MRKETFLNSFDVDLNSFLASGEKRKVWYDIMDDGNLWMFELQNADGEITYDEYRLTPDDVQFDQLLADSNSITIEEALKKIQDGSFTWYKGPQFNGNWISYVHVDIERSDEK